LLASLAEAIAALHPNRRIRVAIDGVDGAGKTMFADALAPVIAARGRAVIRASVDDFLYPRAIRYARGRHSPDGFFLDSYDYEAFRRLLLDPLGLEGSGRYTAKHFDHRVDAPVAALEQQAPPSAALIVDGIFLHRPELRGCWDLSIFLHVTTAVSLARNAARDGIAGQPDPDTPANRRYVGGQQRYLAECAPAEAADIVIDYNEFAAPKIVKWQLRPI
jgi:uridine kinase